MNIEGALEDWWIQAIPTDNVYAPCPCGCGSKWKFVRDNPVEHEKRAKEKMRITFCPLTFELTN